MIIEIFNTLTQAIEKGIFIAMAASSAWGILSIILSPCHLSSIPLIIGFIGGQQKSTIKRAFILSLLFSLGILITIGLIGFITGMAGRMMGDIGKWGHIFVAIIFFIAGLYLWDIIKFPFFNRISQPQYKKKGYLASFILGLIFGIALGPCTFAYMAPMLAVVFKISSTRFMYSILLIVMYAAGHCSVIILAGTFTETVEKYLHWTSSSKGTLILKKICGILVILGGIYLLTTI